MMIAQVIGAVMIALFFGGVFVLIAVKEGWRVALGLFVFVSIVTAWFVAAAYFLTSR